MSQNEMVIQPSQEFNTALACKLSRSKAVLQAFRFNILEMVRESPARSFKELFSK